MHDKDGEVSHPEMLLHGAYCAKAKNQIHETTHPVSTNGAVESKEGQREKK